MTVEDRHDKNFGNKIVFFGFVFGIFVRMMFETNNAGLIGFWIFFLLALFGPIFTLEGKFGFQFHPLG